MGIYSDINAHYLETSNAEQVIDEAAINQSIATILTTIPGQRVFRPQFGCALMSKLFEPMSEVVETE